ncbi:hypothetical protein EV140_0574 [Microcella alkaliphila]|uniref:Uncharacterized protein n=1 Tax=Microcella alkaliphila TaxID=279828 RepID=A0A4Q7TVP8_9MICO|nr:hypothetical protein [Microcella alkaliphila]RZT64330.1 hypothetical protein EV140_0574 [Microcella alkaliphila]
MADTPQPDPTRVRAQPQLTTASGTVWVVMGLITSVLVGGMFVALWARLDSSVALVGAAIAAALTLGMLVARFAVRPGRLRLALLAAAFLTMIASSLVLVLAVTAGA